MLNLHKEVLNGYEKGDSVVTWLRHLLKFRTFSRIKLENLNEKRNLIYIYISNQINDVELNVNNIHNSALHMIKIFSINNINIALLYERQNLHNHHAVYIIIFIKNVI